MLYKLQLRVLQVTLWLCANSGPIGLALAQRLLEFAERDRQQIVNSVKPDDKGV